MCRRRDAAVGARGLRQLAARALWFHGESGGADGCHDEGGWARSETELEVAKKFFREQFGFDMARQALSAMRDIWMRKFPWAIFAGKSA